MTKKMLLKLLFLSTATLLTSVLAQADDLPKVNDNKNITQKKVIIPAFTAHYTILHKSDPIGKAIRKLEYLDDGMIKYSYSTDSQWFIITDKRAETTLVKLNKNNVVPLHYKYIRTGTGRDKNYEWLYNPEKNTGKNIVKNKKFTFDFSENLQNPLSYHLQHRIRLIENQQNKTDKKQFSYQVIKTSGAIKEYLFEYDGKEELILPYGLVKTVRFKREVPKKKRITYAWFAPELNYLLVRLYQVKAGTGKLEAQLTSVVLD